MPFTGPEGQGPYDSVEACIADIEDNDDIDDPAGLCAYWKELDENQANAMSEPNDEPEYRQHYSAAPIDVSTRQVDDESEDGLMVVRMPIASTGDVRNEGDDPLSREEIDGMARQVNEAGVGTFPSHGDDDKISRARYSPFEKLGFWDNADVDDEREDEDSALLVADAVMPDPETLPAVTGSYREALAILKEQAKRGIPLSASIGWRDAEGSPGGVDLMEASIVGIPADPRTVTQGGPAAAVARAAVDAGADPEALVEAVRAAVTGDEDPAADTEHDMTEDDETEPEAENEAAGADDEASTEDERQEAPEWAADLRELLETMNETLGDVADAVRQEEDDDEDDDDDDDDDEEENESDDDEDDEDEDEENSQDADVTADQRAALETLRDGGFNVDDLDLPEPDDEQDADADSDGSEPEPDTRDTDTDDEHPLDKYAFPQ